MAVCCPDEGKHSTTKVNTVPRRMELFIKLLAKFSWWGLVSGNSVRNNGIKDATVGVTMKIYGRNSITENIWQTSCIPILYRITILAVLRIRDVYPRSWFLPIPDPGSQNSNWREGWKKICCHSILCSHIFHKIENNFSLKCWRKKFGPIFKELYNFIPKKLSPNSQKSEIRDPRSRKNLFRILGSKGTGSRIQIRNTAF